MLVDFLTSNYVILLSLAIAGFFLLRPHRWVVPFMWNDPLPWVRTLSRLSIGSIVALLLWATVFDNWRQLLGLLVAERQRWKSDLYLTAPPSDAVRWITLALFVLAVLGGAFLFARYAGGYFFPILALPVGLVLFYSLNGFRMRFDVVGSLWQEDPNWASPTEVLATLAWFGVDQLILVALILAVYAMFWGPVAIIVALILRRTVLREHIDEPALFKAIRERRESANEAVVHETSAASQ